MRETRRWERTGSALAEPALRNVCAESLMSENRTRLDAMQRADKNIEERLKDLTDNFHRLRQSAIDDELFDLIAGYEALNVGAGRGGPSRNLG